MLSKRHHKFMVIAVAALLAAWFAWSALLVETDLPPPETPPAEAP